MNPALNCGFENVNSDPGPPQQMSLTLKKFGFDGFEELFLSKGLEAPPEFYQCCGSGAYLTPRSGSGMEKIRIRDPG